MARTSTSTANSTAAPRHPTVAPDDRPLLTTSHPSKEHLDQQRHTSIKIKPAITSGGRHLYYRAPQDVVIGSTSGGATPLGAGIDTRGPGAGGRAGYVVGPGAWSTAAPTRSSVTVPWRFCPAGSPPCSPAPPPAPRRDGPAAGRRAVHCRCERRAPDGTQGAACSRPATAEDLQCDVCRIGCHPLPRSQHPTTRHRACLSALADHGMANR
ncbi:bifunctional DNA primase/polymerase [Actinomadura physcomitrii]|uniref:bifunctional DNA primase/polymerase n=1 Tax=Actinomadura physcomitrii TaxID=2650748 RepID=UPI0038B2D816